MKSLTTKNMHNKLSMIGKLAIITVLAFTPSLISANTFIGDAYGARIELTAASLVGVGATIVDDPDLPSNGSNVALTNGLLTASVDASATGESVDAFTVLDSGTIMTSTIGPNFFVDSFSPVEDLILFPGIGFSLPSAFPLPAITLNLSSLVTADLIRSDTSADANGNSGRTAITNLRFGSDLLNDELSANAFGVVTLFDNEMRTFYLGILGTVSENPNDRPTAIAELIINDQILSNNGSTRTTNALTVNVLRGNALANGTVIVSSSTAGFVVPETGSIVYAGLAGSMIMGTTMVKLRRKTAK